MELTELHKEWIADLRRYPERQRPRTLGYIAEGCTYACCLGQLLLTADRLGLEEARWFESRLFSLNGSDVDMDIVDYDKFGLASPAGNIQGGWQYNKHTKFTSLADANDGGATWSEIADFIEQNPDKVFVE
jgi:hypothetical protein